VDKNDFLNSKVDTNFVPVNRADPAGAGQSSQVVIVLSDGEARAWWQDCMQTILEGAQSDSDVEEGFAAIGPEPIQNEMIVLNSTGTRIKSSQEKSTYINNLIGPLSSDAGDSAAFSEHEMEQSHDISLSITVQHVQPQREVVGSTQVSSISSDKYPLVTAITIYGNIQRDMYDDQPGVAYFQSPSSIVVPVLEPLNLSDAMDVALVAWTQNRRENGLDDKSDDDSDGYDGRFYPHKILLCDKAGSAIQQFDGRAWESKFAPPSEWPALLAQAEKLDSQASEERHWDNFSTAQGCVDAAGNLRNRVAIAKAHYSTLEPSLSVSTEPVMDLAMPTSERVASEFSATDRGNRINTNPLNAAISALELASKCGGELDLPVYMGAMKGLHSLTVEIRRYDQALNEREAAPTGGDYNALLDILGLPSVD